MIGRVALVTGAGGFVGRELCRQLAAQGESFVGVLSPGAAPDPKLACGANGSYLPLDLSVEPAIQNLVRELQPDRIFNLAAVGVAANPVWPLQAYLDVNVRLPGALCSGMPPDCVLVHAGSMSQYRGGPSPLNEDLAERSSANLYGWSKNAADDLLQLLQDEGSKSTKHVVRARLFGIVGPGEGRHRLLPSIVAGAALRAPMDLSDGQQVRDVLHVHDVASALRHLASSPVLDGLAVNVGRGTGRPVRWIAERAAQRTGRGDLLRFGAIPRRAGEADILVADTTRLSATGWSPALTLEESIDRAVDELVLAREREANGAAQL